MPSMREYCEGKQERLLSNVVKGSNTWRHCMDRPSRWSVIIAHLSPQLLSLDKVMISYWRRSIVFLPLFATKGQYNSSYARKKWALESDLLQDKLLTMTMSLTFRKIVVELPQLGCLVLLFQWHYQLTLFFTYPLNCVTLRSVASISLQGTMSGDR